MTESQRKALIEGLSVAKIYEAITSLVDDAKDDARRVVEKSKPQPLEQVRDMIAANGAFVALRKLQGHFDALHRESQVD